MVEIWKPIENCKNLYFISNLGRVKNQISGHIYKTNNRKGDYLSVNLILNEQRKSIRIHRLVAKAFIPNPNNLPCVNHIDGNKQNNCVDNLEWCTHRENIMHSIKMGNNNLGGINKYNKNKSFIKYGYIYQYDLENNLLNKFYSAKIASETTGVCCRNILQCINKQENRKQAGGYIWVCDKGGDKKC